MALKVVRDALPPNWRQTRDRWLTASKVRTALGLLDLTCLILATQSDTKRGETSIQHMNDGGWVR